jgi:hypothetical protein
MSGDVKRGIRLAALPLGRSSDNSEVKPFLFSDSFGSCYSVKL